MSQKALKHKDHSLSFNTTESDLNQFLNVFCNSCYLDLGRINLIFILRNLG
jgi:hypothetical protein